MRSSMKPPGRVKSVLDFEIDLPVMLPDAVAPRLGLRTKPDDSDLLYHAIFYRENIRVTKTPPSAPDWRAFEGRDRTSVSDVFLLVVRWVHLVSAAAWIGGSLFYLLVLRPALRRSPESSGGVGVLAASEFRALVDTSIFVLLATGVIGQSAGANNRVRDSTIAQRFLTFELPVQNITKHRVQGVILL